MHCLRGEKLDLRHSFTRSLIVLEDLEDDQIFQDLVLSVKLSCNNHPHFKQIRRCLHKKMNLKIIENHLHGKRSFIKVTMPKDNKLIQ